MTRQGDYCIEHTEVLRREGCITEKRFRELKLWGDFRQKHSEISELTEGACTPLMRVTDSDIQAKAIEAVDEQIKRGNVPTGKQVKQLIVNNRRDATPKNVNEPAEIVDLKERLAREALELQKRREERAQHENDREIAEIEVKNENTIMRDKLAEALTIDFKKAVKEGIPEKYLSDALEMALDNIFEPLQNTPENEKITVIEAHKMGRYINNIEEDPDGIKRRGRPRWSQTF